jgi:hypothetical protein
VRIGDEHVDEFLVVVPIPVPVDEDDDVLLSELLIVSYILIESSPKHKIRNKSKNIKSIIDFSQDPVTHRSPMRQLKKAFLFNLFIFKISKEQRTTKTRETKRIAKVKVERGKRHVII